MLAQRLKCKCTLFAYGFSLKSPESDCPTFSSPQSGCQPNVVCRSARSDVIGDLCRCRWIRPMWTHTCWCNSELLTSSLDRSSECTNNRMSHFYLKLLNSSSFPHSIRHFYKVGFIHKQRGILLHELWVTVGAGASCSNFDSSLDAAGFPKSEHLTGILQYIITSV